MRVRCYLRPWWGLVFGVITYGIYDLTNYATLDKWSLRYVVVDIAWAARSAARDDHGVDARPVVFMKSQVSEVFRKTLTGLTVSGGL